jgi:tetratricopeptide (TPR) repeat protein
MNRLIIGGILALATGVSSLMAQKPPQPKSQKEVEALQAMFNAQDPDTRIKAAEDLLAKFSDTEFKSIALYFEAASYEQKGDFDKVVIYGERTLEADPKNYQAMLLLARQIAVHTREHDLDKEEKLNKADKYAKSALDTVKDAPKPNPQMTDQQWDEAKKDLTAQAHEAQGLSAMVRKKYDVAVNEFKFAVDNSATPDPATMVRLGAAYNLSGKPDDAVAILDKVMALPNLHPSIRQFAQAERVRAVQAKNGGKAPAPAAPAPPQVEVKKP